MGMIETMAMTNAFAQGVIPFGSALPLWAGMIGMLLAAAVGIALSGQRTPTVPRIRLVRPTARVLHNAC